MAERSTVVDGGLGVRSAGLVHVLPEAVVAVVVVIEDVSSLVVRVRLEKLSQTG